nr:MAG TPA: hypothetical protein [Caudoviricetes sp.]
MSVQFKCIAENRRKIGIFSFYSLTSILRTQRATTR